MPFANNEGVKIHYQVEGKGTPIVLVTGFTGSIDIWYNFSYVESLKQKYQLILIDKRGHGKSGKPYNPEDYLQEKLTSDIIAVMDELQVDKAHFWGYSYGGYIGLILAKHYPDRFHSFILGGVSPQEISEEQSKLLDTFFETMRRGKEAYISSIEEQGDIPPEYRKEIESWDFDALSAATMSEDIFKNMDSHLPEIDIPFLFYSGEEDVWDHYQRQIEFVKKMKNARMVGIPGFGHEVSKAKDLILPHVLEFLENIEK